MPSRAHLRTVAAETPAASATSCTVILGAGTRAECIRASRLLRFDSNYLKLTLMAPTHRDPDDLLPPSPLTPDANLDPSSEIEVDLSEDPDPEAVAPARVTTPEGVEYLGEYESVEDYLRSMLEPEISSGCRWVLDCLDFVAVLTRFEAAGARYFCEHGRVYRTILGSLILIFSLTGHPF
jgi:hypothetical protein